MPRLSNKKINAKAVKSAKRVVSLKGAGICTGCAREYARAAKVKMEPGMLKCPICGFSMGKYSPELKRKLDGKT